MAAAVIEVLGTVITGVELANQIADVGKRWIPEPPKHLKDKFRWIQCTLKNETQFDIILLDSYFDSGRYWTVPEGAKKFHQMTWSACNGDHTIMTGATGGTAFRLSLDHKHYMDFSLGWTAPAAGPFTAGVALSHKGVNGYNAASAHGGSVMSGQTFEGKDKHGKKTKFKIHVSASPGQKTVFTVKQIPVDDHHGGGHHPRHH